MNNFKLTTIAGLLLSSLTLNVSAAEADVAELDARVSIKVQQLIEVGLLPTSLEIEVLAGDIVDRQIESGEMTVELAVEKYELIPSLERYIKLKETIRLITEEGSGDGSGNEPK
jgi:hypothetical protein